MKNISNFHENIKFKIISIRKEIEQKQQTLSILNEIEKNMAESLKQDEQETTESSHNIEEILAEYLELISQDDWIEDWRDMTEKYSSDDIAEAIALGVKRGQIDLMKVHNKR